MSMKRDLDKLEQKLASLNRLDAQRVEDMVHLSAAGAGLEELGEGDLEDAAGGACGTFSCGLFRVLNSPDEAPT